MSLQALAAEFRTKYQLSNGFTADSLDLQWRLIDEEQDEVWDAYLSLKSDLTNRRSKEHLLKEVADLTYVCFQLAEAFGWDLEEAFRLVHESNLSKLDAQGNPIRNEAGKILKGPNYKEPSLIHLV